MEFWNTLIWGHTRKKEIVKGYCSPKLLGEYNYGYRWFTINQSLRWSNLKRSTLKW